jgi:glyoxylase-like metal-dependent hydrolase (beta-lactamase superfamily II)
VIVLVDGFPAGPPATNCYVVAPGPGEQCVVIDPGIGAEQELDELLARHRLTPVAVLLTHGHIDHTFSVLPVCGARDVPAYIHPGDRPQLTDPWSWMGARPGTPMFGRLTWTEPDDVRELVDLETIELAGMSLRVELTPGHTPGSVCFAAEAGTGPGAPEVPLLIAGDLVFAGSVGRTDLPGGSHEQLLHSIATRVLPRPDETVILPGHGPATTVGRERATNPFLIGLDAVGLDLGGTGTTGAGRDLPRRTGL